MAFCDYHTCDLCRNAKTFYDAEMHEHDWHTKAIFALCGECLKTHRIVAVERDDEHRACENCGGRGLPYFESETCTSCGGSGLAQSAEPSGKEE